MSLTVNPRMSPFCLACRKPGHTTTQCHSTHGLNTAEDHELFRLCEAARQWERHAGAEYDHISPNRPKHSDAAAGPGLSDLSKALQNEDRPGTTGHHGFAHAGIFQPVVDQIIRMIREQAAHAAPGDGVEVPQAIQAWREARAEAIRTNHAYSAAVQRAEEIDAVKGFGYTDVNLEFQAMSAASRRAHQLLPAAMDALYQWRQPRMAVAGAQSRFVGQPWAQCSVEHHHLVQATPADWMGYETRLIYVPADDEAAAHSEGPGAALSCELIPQAPAAVTVRVHFDPDAGEYLAV